MKKTHVVKLLVLFFSLTISSTGIAQTLSPSAKISLLTCGSGEELYSTFGHSAIRVCDTTQTLDAIFNYGTFSFSDPNFYMNFVRGKLNYMLGIQTFEYFMAEYKMDDRRVYEQTLNLTTEQRQALFNFLLRNSLPDNRFYLYDFLFDNCSTRIRDVLNKVFPGQIIFPDRYADIVDEPTFRDLLHSHLNDSPWTKLGIDMLLGKRVDRIATANEYMFLPDYLLAAFEKATINEQPLVSEFDFLYQSSNAFASKKPLIVPMPAFRILLVLVVAAYIMKAPLKWFDFTIFFIVGLLGFLLLFMWFGTDHYVTKYNFNLLWAIPIHAVAAFFLFKKQRPQWMLWYFAANALICILLLVFRNSLPQRLNDALVPIVCILGFRSYVIAKALFVKPIK
ncbi:MAG: DUF4105 domain-containing protein [Prevotellaceae bacterium]|jgi:hypothetical protein|nr:DUF4105 domain-containing protein [Prevotellaceae bacterium]